MFEGTIFVDTESHWKSYRECSTFALEPYGITSKDIFPEFTSDPKVFLRKRGFKQVKANKMQLGDIVVFGHIANWGENKDKFIAHHVSIYTPINNEELFLSMEGTYGDIRLSSYETLSFHYGQKILAYRPSRNSELEDNS